MIKGKTWSARLFDVTNHALLMLFGVLCIVPIIHILAVSFSDRAATAGGFVTLWPIRFTTVSYAKIIESGTFWGSLFVSIERTVLGTLLSMAVTVLTAYPLAKTHHEFKGRTLFMWMIIWAMLFSGGLIPWFLVIWKLGMLNTLWALIFPGALQIWNVILMMNFFRDIPKELDEAAFIDGASHWRILRHVYLPLSLAGLATLSVFTAVAHWNSWFDGMVVISDPSRYPLQTFLRSVVIVEDLTQVLRNPVDFYKYSDRSIKAAQIFVTTLPILVLYPFLQRYFVAGLKLGSVKG